MYMKKDKQNLREKKINIKIESLNFKKKLLI